MIQFRFESIFGQHLLWRSGYEDRKNMYFQSFCDKNGQFVDGISFSCHNPRNLKRNAMSALIGKCLKSKFPIKDSQAPKACNWGDFKFIK